MVLRNISSDMEVVQRLEQSSHEPEALGSIPTSLPSGGLVVRTIASSPRGFEFQSSYLTSRTNIGTF